MPGDKDLIEKADALLRRHAAGGNEPGGVPVLTDLVEEAPAAAEAQPFPESDLTQQVFEHVMREVEGRLANDLERRLIEHLVPQVNAAVASALADLRHEIAHAIGDAVARALERPPVK